MTATHVEPDLPGMLTAENILISADMSTYWNTQEYPNPRYFVRMPKRCELGGWWPVGPGMIFTPSR